MVDQGHTGFTWLRRGKGNVRPIMMSGATKGSPATRKSTVRQIIIKQCRRRLALTASVGIFFKRLPGGSTGLDLKEWIGIEWTKETERRKKNLSRELNSRNQTRIQLFFKPTLYGLSVTWINVLSLSFKQVASSFPPLNIERCEEEVSNEREISQ